jgi:hypothetical protein
MKLTQKLSRKNAILAEENGVLGVGIQSHS